MNRIENDNLLTSEELLQLKERQLLEFYERQFVNYGWSVRCLCLLVIVLSINLLKAWFGL